MGEGVVRRIDELRVCKKMTNIWSDVEVLCDLCSRLLLRGLSDLPTSNNNNSIASLTEEETPLLIGSRLAPAHHGRRRKVGAPLGH